MGGRLDVAGDEAEQHSGVDQPVEDLLDTGHQAIAVGLGDRLGQLPQVGGDDPRALGLLALAADHLAEDDRRDLGIGHPFRGVLGDVDVDAVQLLERVPPGDPAGAARHQQGAVDVE